MKQIVFFLALIIHLSVFSQTNEYPNVVEDIAKNQTYTIDWKFNFFVPGVMGVGAGGSYYKPNLFHIAGEAGLGWTYKYKKEGPNKKWVMPWYGIKAGFPLYFISSGNVKWVFSRSSEWESFYRIKAPVHHIIIPEVGLFFNPVGYDTKQYIAPVFKAGISWRTIVNADVEVKDSNTGRVRSGRLKRHSEFSAGILFATKDEISGPNMADPAIKTEKLGFYVLLGLPIWGQTVNIAINTIGYDNQSQFLVGWTFNIK